MHIIILISVLLLLVPWLLNVDLALVSPTDLGTDLITKQWPNAAYIAQAWRRWGEVPLWHKTLLGGVPIIGNPSMLLAYPPYWLIFLFPIGWAFTLYFTLHLIWAGWGTYNLARRVLGLSPEAALLAALTFALSAKLMAHLGGGHLDIITAIAWLPWLWWAVDVLARKPNWGAVVTTAVAVTAQMLTHLPTLWVNALITGGWVLFVRFKDQSPGTLRHWLRTGAALLAALILALGLSAVQMWPMLELLPFSTRGAMELSEASKYALPPPLLIGLLFPTSLAFPEWSIYVGIVTLALAPVSWLVRGSTKGWPYLVALIIFGIAFSLGTATPLYPLLFRILPGMKWLRVPSRMMFMVQLSCALLAGIGGDALARVDLRQMPVLLIWWTMLVLLLCIGTFWGYLFPGVLAVPIGAVIVATLTLGVLIVKSKVSLLSRRDPFVLAMLAVLEAIVLAPQFLAQEEISKLTAPTPAIKFLKSQPGYFRVYSPEGLISPAQAVAHDLETADGNDPFQLNHYVNWANAASGCRSDAYAVRVPTCTSNVVDSNAHRKSQPDPSLLGVGNVRYIITEQSLDKWSPPIWQTDSLKVYDNPGMLPPAFVVPTIRVQADDSAALNFLQTQDLKRVASVTSEPQDSFSSATKYRVASMISRMPNQIEVQAEGPGWLVLSEVWAPGWRASLDGTEVKVYRTNVAFCGMPLSKGSHTVILEYAPTGWIWGRWVSLSTWLLTIVVTTVVLWNQQH